MKNLEWHKSQFRAKQADGTIIAATKSTMAHFGQQDGPIVMIHAFDDTSLGKNLLGIASIVNQGNTATYTKSGCTITNDKSGSILAHISKLPHEFQWQGNFDFFPVDNKIITANYVISNSPIIDSLDNAIVSDFAFTTVAYNEIEFDQYPQSFVCANDENENSANIVVSNKFDADFVTFVHASFGSPSFSTFYDALRNKYLSSFPRITASMAIKNEPISAATHLGHLDLIRQGTNSTIRQTIPVSKPFSTEDIVKIEQEEYPNGQTSPNQQELLFTRIQATSDFISADATGRLPPGYRARNGDQYILVSCWNNYIHMEPFKNRDTSSLCEVYKRTINFFRELKATFTMAQLDNECPQDLTALLKELVGTAIKVPTHDHRRLLAERAIRTAKNHIIAIMATISPTCPHHLLTKFLPQAELTLAHLRAWGSNPAISSYEGLFGKKFDFSAHPIVPLGMEVVVHDTPSVRNTWADHGTRGFYVGPVLDKYREFLIYMPKTGKFRESSQVGWLPTPYNMPGSSPIEVVTTSINALTTALQSLANVKHWTPDQKVTFQNATSSVTKGLQDIAALWKPPNPSEPLVHIQGVAAIPQQTAPPSVLIQGVAMPPQAATPPSVLTQGVATQLPPTHKPRRSVRFSNPNTHVLPPSLAATPVLPPTLTHELSKDWLADWSQTSVEKEQTPPSGTLHADNERIKAIVGQLPQAQLHMAHSAITAIRFAEAQMPFTPSKPDRRPR